MMLVLVMELKLYNEMENDEDKLGFDVFKCKTHEENMYKFKFSSNVMNTYL